MIVAIHHSRLNALVKIFWKNHGEMKSIQMLELEKSLGLNLGFASY